MEKEIIEPIADISTKEKLTLKDAEFIFNQGEKLLKDSLETSTVIVSRTGNLVPIVATLLVTLSGFLITKLTKDFIWSELIITALLGICYLMVLAYSCTRNLIPRKYQPVGSMPGDLFDKSFFGEKIKNDERILRFYVSEIENYNYRIKENNIQNRRRWLLYKNTLWGIFLFPVAMLCSYIVTSFLLTKVYCQFP